MATKNISLTEDAYNSLSSLKEDDESFSDVVKKITAKHTIMDLFGILSDKEANRLEKEVSSMREQSNKRQKTIAEQLS